MLLVPHYVHIMSVYVTDGSQLVLNSSTSSKQTE